MSSLGQMLIYKWCFIESTGKRGKLTVLNWSIVKTIDFIPVKVTFNNSDLHNDASNDLQFLK